MLRRSWPQTVMLSLVGLVWLAGVLFPFYWLLMLSLKTQNQAFATPPLFVFRPTLEHYVDLALNTDFPRFFGNSVIVAVGTVALSLGLGVPAAYGFSRWKSRASGMLLAWILILRMVPGLTYIIPFFLIYKRLDLLDTHLGLVLIYTIFNLALVIWCMQAFFDEVPRTLEESSYVDGATRLQAFLKIILPLAAPGLAATAVLCFLFSWNEFLFALIVTRFQARTAPVGITNFMAYEGVEWGRVAAGSVIILIPVLVFAVIVRRYLVRGLLAGAVKG
jgi:multiple sugar transport system permease protein